MDTDHILTKISEIDSDLLIAEYEYAAQTAFQANEDRARVTQLYVLSVASFVVGSISIQLEQLKSPYTYFAFSGLFVILGAASLLSILQLVELRRAWFYSALEMAKIKEFYLSKSPDLSDAFLWTRQTIPPRRRLRSVAFLLAIQIGITGGGVIGTAVVFFGLGVGQWWLIQGVITGMLFSAFAILAYWYLVGLNET